MKKNNETTEKSIQASESQAENAEDTSDGEVCLELDNAIEIQSTLKEIALTPGIPEDVKEAIEKVTHEISIGVHHSSQSFSGPIPPPQILASFNEVIPGLASKIVEWADVEGKHRREIENKQLDAEIRFNNRGFDERRLGQILGFFIGTIAIIAGAVTAILGSPVAGAFIGSGGVVGLVSAFLYSKKSEPSTSAEETEE